MPRPDAAFVLAVGNVQHPVQRVFDLPVAANCIREYLGISVETRNEVSCLCRLLALYVSRRVNGPNTCQTGPSPFDIKRFDSVWSRDGLANTAFQCVHVLCRWTHSGRGQGSCIQGGRHD